MEEWTVALVSALWFGVLTSISLCPLATNIAAISFVGRRVANPRQVLAAGLLYTGGRMLTYIVLGIVLVTSLLSVPSLSYALQKYMNLALGPLLILVGMVLLELITFQIGGSGVSESMQKRIEGMNVWGAGLLGILFALSFCPTSAALFFGSVLPLAVKWQSEVMLPAIYGIATGLPVMLFAGLIAVGTQKVAKAYNQVVSLERWARYITGGLFILVGIYYCLVYIWGVPIL